MTDSLHRACPARFSGSDLSRRSAPIVDGIGVSRAAPQPLLQFQAEPRGDARIFCGRQRPSATAVQGAREKADLLNLLDTFGGHYGSHALLRVRVARMGILPSDSGAAFLAASFFCAVSRQPRRRGIVPGRPTLSRGEIDSRTAAAL